MDNTVDLHLNVNKCKMLCIGRKKNFVPIELQSIPIVNELKILGVIFDSRDNWNAHVNNIVKSASRRLFLTRLLKPHVTEENLITIFNGLVRSITEYCSPLFIGLSKSNSHKLERVLYRFHRLLCGDSYKSCAVHDFMSLTERRKQAALKLFKQTLTTTHIMHALTPHISPAGRVILPVSRTTRRSNSFFVRVSQLFNNEFVRS